MADISAILRGVRISPQKARLVADQVRGKKIDNALNILTFSPKKGAEIIKKVVESAIANAENNNGADIDTLKVKPDVSPTSTVVNSLYTAVPPFQYPITYPALPFAPLVAAYLTNIGV